MRVVEPHQFYSLHQPNQPSRKFIRLWFIFLAATIISVSILGIWSYNIPLPKVSAKAVTVNSPGTKVNLPWPVKGQAAIGAKGFGLLESSAGQTAVPTASVAKIMTALAVLKVKPLSLNQSGPSITLTETDEQLFRDYIAKDGTVALVKAGERLTEYQALQAMLLPSANNIADTLVNWAFGSVEKYSVYANKLAKEIGLTQTTITSASGYAPQTVSSANDLVKLGLLAMENPVIAQIVAQKTAKIPVAGEIKNVNFLLDSDGIVGIKTGNTDQAGGCYLFASKNDYSNGQTVTLIGAVLGASNLVSAMQDSKNLIKAAFANFEYRTLINAGDKLGYYDLPWGGQAVATADKKVTDWHWKGSSVNANIYLNDIDTNTKAGSIVGVVKNGKKSSNILITSDIAMPNQIWRLKRWL